MERGFTYAVWENICTLSPCLVGSLLIYFVLGRRLWKPATQSESPVASEGGYRPALPEAAEETSPPIKDAFRRFIEDDLRMDFLD